MRMRKIDLIGAATADGPKDNDNDCEGLGCAPAMAPLDARPVYRAIKRSFDVCFSAAMLILLSPLMILTALAVRLDSPGPSIFRQTRVGKDGRLFTFYKFRSMCADAEDQLEGIRDLNEKDGPVFKIADDPRITRVGRFIRRTSIDELPQFWNVLKGEMSVVGPRPALPNEVAQYTPYQRRRLLMRPGITCYWQTRFNRDAISFDAWMEMDLRYLRDCSVWTDLKLIVKTLGVVFTGQGN